ncbi:hypothetical protein [Methylobacterium fujisawaense]
MTDDMSQSSGKSTDRSDDELERLRGKVLELLVPGPARDRLAKMSIAELREVDLQSRLWAEVQEAGGDPDRHRLH